MIYNLRLRYKSNNKQMKVTDIAFHNDGMLVTFDDNSTAVVKYYFKNDTLRLSGLNPEQEAALRTISADELITIVDPRSSRLHYIIDRVRTQTRLVEVSIPLPDIAPNGTVDVGLWMPKCSVVIKTITVGYAASPAPLASDGTVILKIIRVRNQTQTELQSDSSFDLTLLLDAVPKEVDLIAGRKSVECGDYICANITSNSDVVQGSGGVITIAYQITVEN